MDDNIMKWVKRVPVLGQLVKSIKAIIKLPQTNEVYQTQLNECRAVNNELIKLINEQQTEINYLHDKISGNQLIYDGFDYLIRDNNMLEKLNLQLSSNLTLWGNKNRLHISELASVFTCLFNTNSGDITVGDYTFAGSGVSVLAGSHDMYLEGLPRRDSEIKCGCDIIIGNGVWLGSGCTILGPCNIGNNAVIGAGAVVTPGSEIPDNALCVGIPAKVIKLLDTEKSIDGDHIRAAIEREDGILFVDGWTEKRPLMLGDYKLLGHWMYGLDATIYTNKIDLHFLCHSEKSEASELIFKTQYGQTKVLLNQGDTDVHLPLSQNESGLNSVQVLCEPALENNLFIAAI